MTHHTTLIAGRFAKRLLLAVLAGLQPAILPVWAQTEPPPDWIRRDPVNTSLNSVAHGLNRFIAVGNNGYWFTSPNGQTWTVRAPLTDGHLTAIHFANNRFVAVGDGIYSSTDGVNWAQASLAYTRLALTDVASDGAGNWMAVGRTIQSDGTPGNGLTFTSTDGASWTRASLGAPEKIAFGAGRWFGTSLPDSSLVEWVEVEIEPGSFEYSWQTFIPEDLEAPQPTGRLIRFLNDRFVLCGFNSADDPAGAHHVFTSTDGVNWPKGTVTNQGLPAQRANQPRYSVMRDLAFGGGVFVGIAAGSPSSTSEAWFRADAMTSTDGVNWGFLADRTSLVTATGSEALTDIAHANGQFVAVGYRHTTPLRNTVVTTPDGLTWTSRSFNPRALQRSASESAVALASGDGLVVAVTQWGGAAVSDDDGVTWGYAGVTAGNLSLGTIAHGGGRFVAGGQQGWAYRSMDGYSWDSVQVPDAFHVWDVIHDGTRFVAVGQYRDAGNTVQRGIASRSADGASWDTVQIPATSRLEEVAFGNGAYVALGVTQAPSASTVQVSANAIDWSTVNGAPALIWIAFGGGRFLGVSGNPGNPQFHVSVNGVDWTLIETTVGTFFTPFFEVESLTHVNGHFVLGGTEMGVLFLDENDRWVLGGGPNRAAGVTFSGTTYIATSLWTHTLPEPEPPLEPPVLTWQRLGDVLRLEFPARPDHQYQLWQRGGLGSQWMAIDGFVAQEELGQFEVFMDLFGIEPQWYQISVEPPGAGF